MAFHPWITFRSVAIGALAAASIAACTPVHAPGDDGNAPATRRFAYADGGSAIYYVLDMGPRTVSHVPETYVFVIGGSECASMKAWLPQYFRGLEGRSGPMRIFVVHKRHVEEQRSGPAGACSEAFTRADHARRWIADYLEFARSRLAGPRPRRIVLVGISEGGEVVPALARRLPGVSHVVLLASAAMDPLEAFTIQAARFSLPGWQAVRDAALGPAPEDPDASRQDLGGRSWRYWSELRGLEPTPNLLALEIPILVAMGTRDQSVPPEGATRLRDSFAKRSRTNLTVLTYDGADHALFDRDRGLARLPEFWGQVDRWLMLEPDLRGPR